MVPQPVVCQLPKAPNITGYKGKLVIFSAFYNYMGHAPYIAALLNTCMVLERVGIEWDFKCIYGDFHFDRALNQVMTQVMKSDATDIVVIDTDLHWKPEAILRMLGHDVDIVSGSYRMKNDWVRYTGQVQFAPSGAPAGRILADGTCLLAADRVTGGFTRFRTSALRRYAEAYPELHYHHNDGMSVGFWHTEIKDHVYRGHDYLQSDRWRAIGAELWIDPTFDITHYGMTGYEGNLDKFLKGETPQQAFETVKAMAKEIAGRDPRSAA